MGKTKKLVRDRIPELMDKEKKNYSIIKVSDDGYNDFLKIKLVEEANEVLEAKTKDGLIEELADTLEVIDAMIELYNIPMSDVIEVKNNKANERGKFDDKIVMKF